jgi:hypothetical protein
VSRGRPPPPRTHTCTHTHTSHPFPPPIPIIAPLAQVYIRHLWDDLGVDPARYVLADGTVGNHSFYAEELFYVQNDPAGFDSPPWPDALTRSGPKMARLGANDGPRNVVLYISRAEGRKRSIVNEGELLAAMRAALREDLELVHLVRELGVRL